MSYMKTARRKTCRLCDSPQLTELFSLGNLAISTFVLSGCFHTGLTRQPNATEAPAAEVQTSPNQTAFVSPRKTPHHESSTPDHAAVLPAPPYNIVINFNFDLATGSQITITNNGRDYAAGQASIDTNKLALRRTMNQAAPNGTYTVDYKACWPDGSCHDGSFQFTIDQSQASDYIDLRQNQAVTISLTNNGFNPQFVRVAKNTPITWINNDSVVHYVNTDPHAGHNFYPLHNSRALNQGDTFVYTFPQPGIYPYHCSAHAAIMTGAVLVE